MKKLIIILSAGVLVSGCASNRGTLDPMEAASLLLAGGAGYIGYNETKDESRDKNMLVTAAAAGGAYLAGQFIKGKINNDMVKEFNSGYSLGTSNAAKTQYWIIQSRQRDDEWFDKKASQANYKYYSFPGEKYAPDGSKLVDHDIILRVIE